MELEFYFPKTKSKHRCVPTTGKVYPSKGGTIRYGVQATMNGSKSLPKYIKEEEFNRLGFSAETFEASVSVGEKQVRSRKDYDINNDISVSNLTIDDDVDLNDYADEIISNYEDEIAEAIRENVDDSSPISDGDTGYGDYYINTNMTLDVPISGNINFDWTANENYDDYDDEWNAETFEAEGVNRDDKTLLREMAYEFYEQYGEPNRWGAWFYSTKGERFKFRGFEDEAIIYFSFDLNSRIYGLINFDKMDDYYARFEDYVDVSRMKDAVREMGEEHGRVAELRIDRDQNDGWDETFQIAGNIRLKKGKSKNAETFEADKEYLSRKEDVAGLDDYERYQLYDEGRMTCDECGADDKTVGFVEEGYKLCGRCDREWMAKQGYEAETFGADYIVDKYKHGIEVREFPKSSSVYQKGMLVKQYRGDGHRIRARSKAQQLEHNYKPKSFFSESNGKVNLTIKEMELLRAIDNNHKGNHWGVDEDEMQAFIYHDEWNMTVYRGVMSSLAKKGIIEIGEPEKGGRQVVSNWVVVNPKYTVGQDFDMEIDWNIFECKELMKEFGVEPEQIFQILDRVNPQAFSQQMGAETFGAESGQMCEVCFGNDDMPYDSDHFTECRRCGKSVCIDCEGEMEHHPEWSKVCAECSNVLDNVHDYGAETFESQNSNMKLALGLTGLGIGLALWKGKELLSLWDRIKEKME